MQLLTQVLQRGAPLGSLLTKRVNVTPKRYLELLSGPDLAIALAVCETCPPSEVDEISLLLFRVFEAKGTLLGLLKVLVEREVNQTSASTALRPLAVLTPARSRSRAVSSKLTHHSDSYYLRQDLRVVRGRFLKVIKLTNVATTSERPCSP